SRAGIALELLDAVRGEGFTASAVVAGAAYGASAEFREGLVRRGLPFLVEVGDDLPVTPGGAGDEGTSPTAGLSWVVTEGGPRVLSNLPPGTTRKQALSLWDQRDRAGELIRRLREGLGLDHFEGRSWMGFHHHASLVLLAHGFHLWRAE